jgi:hypothetical protein
VGPTDNDPVPPSPDYWRVSTDALPPTTALRRRIYWPRQRSGQSRFGKDSPLLTDEDQTPHVPADSLTSVPSGLAGALTLHQSEDSPLGQVGRRPVFAEQFSSAIGIVFTGRGVAQQHYMKSRSLLIVGALMLALVPLPAAASAQRGSGRHHGGRALAGPLVIVGQPVAVRPTVVVVPPVVVRRPIIGRAVPPRIFDRSSFGSIPVRTGFGVEARPMPVPATIGRRHGFKSKGLRPHKPGRVVGGTIVVGYPVPYSYAYPPPYGVTTSSAGHPSRPSNITVFGADGVSAGLPSYSADLVNDTSASGGLNFEVSPAVAEVYVDGIYMGTVQDFPADGEPLRVTPGSHWIELRASGYRTRMFDVSIASGQVTPYQGALEQLRPY